MVDFEWPEGYNNEEYYGYEWEYDEEAYEEWVEYNLDLEDREWYREQEYLRWLEECDNDDLEP